MLARNEVPPHRTTIAFDLRTAADGSLESAASLVAGVLGCTFHEEDVEKVRSMVAELFGLTVSLQPWSIDDQLIYRLRGGIADTRIVRRVEGRAPSVTEIDISPYVLDLLTASGEAIWYIPTRDDHLREAETGAALDDAY
jgi:hypothetical protein